VSWCPNPKLPSGVDVRHVLGNAVTPLCSKEAGFITGQLIAVDGGASLMDPALPLAIQQPELQPA
jgi:enoyl-[acyl-carrier protein] reductase III